MQYMRRFWVYGQCHCNTRYFGDHSKSVIKPYLYYDIFDVASRFFFLNVNKFYVVQLCVLIGPWVTCKPQASLHGFAWSVEPVSFGPIKSMTVTTPQGR